MRRRQLKWLWKRLRQLSAMQISREEMLMTLGAARSKAPSAWRLIDIEMDKTSAKFAYSLNRKKLRTARRREGRYLLRTNLAETDPALLWQYYIQLVAVEQAFKNLKDDLAIRPIFHKEERRIEAHIFVSFLAYCLYITLQRPPAGLGAGAHRAQRAREVRRRSDDRRPSADDRRPRAASHALHRAGAGTAIAPQADEARHAAPAPAKNLRRRRQ